MIIYFLVFTLILLGNFHNLKQSKYYFYFVLITVIIFFCFGYMTGSDWRGYEKSYQYLEESYKSVLELKYEPGFLLYMSLFKSLNIGFWPFLIFTKVVSFLLFIKLINKIYPEEKYLIMGYFLVSFGLYYFIDNPLRNLIADTIYLYSFKYILNKNIIKYLIAVIIASTFHYSALFAIPFYFVFNKNIKSKYWVLSYLLVIVLSISYKDIFVKTILELIPQGSFIGNKIYFYFAESNYIDSNFLSFGGLLKLIFFTLIIYSRDKIVSINKYGLFIFNGGLIFLITNRIGATFEVLSRLQMFSAILFCIAIIVVATKFDADSRRIYKTAIMVVIYLTIIVETTTTYKYIPYTNYLTHSYLNMTYYERSNYNFINSPYKSDEE